MRVAVVELASGLVVNVATVKSDDGSEPAEGFIHVPSISANIGDTWNGSQIIKKPEPPFEGRS